MGLFTNINKKIKILRDLIYLKEEKDFFLSDFKNKENEGYFKVYSPELFSSNSSIDNYSYVATNTIVSDCEIGKFCSIGPNTVIGYGQHPTQWASTSPVFYSTVMIFRDFRSDRSHFEDENARIIIGNDVWIGANVYVKNGVEIGHGSVIAAGSIVVNNVAPYSIIGGSPAKLIRMRFDESTVAELLKIEWWNKDIAILKKLQPYFVSDDIRNFMTEIRKHGS